MMENPQNNKNVIEDKKNETYFKEPDNRKTKFEIQNDNKENNIPAIKDSITDDDHYTGNGEIDPSSETVMMGNSDGQREIRNLQNKLEILKNQINILISKQEEDKMDSKFKDNNINSLKKRRKKDQTS